MFDSIRKTKAIPGYSSDTIPYAELMTELQPVILKNVAKEWGLVQASLQSDAAAIAYLNSFYNGKTVSTLICPPEAKGRFFYDDSCMHMNFESRRMPMDQVLEKIKQHLADAQPPSFYIGSTTIDACLPGMRKTNDLLFNHEMFIDNAPLASIWIGNQTIASAHYDAPNNIACCVAGRRRFILFPPEQIHNLYPGPLEFNPGGQAISMVNFENPDFVKHPRFRDAIAAAQVADLEPGDVLFYPSLWWHQVEALNPFNILINYWWNTSPKFMDTPMNLLKYALLSLRDRPTHEKEGWKYIFEYYIFGDADKASEHLPTAARGWLGPMDDNKARQLRAILIDSLNR